jgi:Domain of unknown function (DUF4411)
MTYSLFPSPTVYLLDTSSVVRLDGKDGVPSAQPFTTAEQAKIWKGLEKFADDGRLKLIKQVKSELWRHDRKGRARLCKYPEHALAIKKTSQVIKLYRDVTTNHSDLMKGGSRREPGDPWLIVAAELFDYVIICEELLRADRSPTLPRRRRNMERIPDVCKARKLRDAIRLRDLAEQEGWI